MRTLVVGGGILGLTLALRLARLGHRVDVFERNPWLGGLACARDYGEFRWDRFYHCILPQDAHLLALLDELGLSSELRWKATRTGYFGRGRFHEMTGGLDFLRFPLLNVLEKARLGAALAYATRFTDPDELYRISAADWLRRLCGRRTFEVFWRPLLRAKFGTWHEDVAAVFMWATLKRLWQKPGEGLKRGTLGYVSGGYDAILRRIERVLAERSVSIRCGIELESLRLAEQGEGGACEARLRNGGAAPELRRYDQVFVTAPVSQVSDVLHGELREQADHFARQHPAARSYLGVVCVVLVLERPLTPYYVLNLGDERVELTGVVEMTNLVDADTQTARRSLVYLPRYVDSGDASFEEPDDAVLERTFARGLAPLFPDLAPRQIAGRFVHRTRHVQPLPTVGDAVPPSGPLRFKRPFQIVNSALLRCATLNNNEIVGLVDEFVGANRTELMAHA